jgi:hypothetical protein
MCYRFFENSETSEFLNSHYRRLLEQADDAPTVPFWLSKTEGIFPSGFQPP